MFFSRDAVKRKLEGIVLVKQSALWLAVTFVADGCIKRVELETMQSRLTGP
jgi:hypothetical protein